MHMGIPGLIWAGETLLEVTHKLSEFLKGKKKQEEMTATDSLPTLITLQRVLIISRQVLRALNQFTRSAPSSRCISRTLKVAWPRLRTKTQPIV